LAALQAALVGGAGDASAQSSACDQLKASLFARIEASGVRDYSLEAVPATAPTPANVRVIGTCDGGRTKVLYYRGAARQTPPDAPAAARPPAVPASKAPVAVRERVPPASPMPASMPALTPVPPPATSPASLPVVVPSPVLQAAPQPAPAQPEVTRQAPEPQAPEPAPTTSLVQQAFSFAAANRIWLLALVLVPIAGWLWAWAAHRRAYDKAGLPRGPRL
jgi:hypothetical protein